MTYVFWLCLALIAYTYFLYPLLLLFFYIAAQVRRDWKYLNGRRTRRRPALDNDHLLAVSLIVAVYNEEAALEKKLANLRQLAYPREKLEILFVSDGSTDRTNEILAAAAPEGVKLIIQPQRRGKAEALNQGVNAAIHEVLIFSDATTLFSPDALRQLVRHFADSTVGVVCGALDFEGTTESKQTEGVYWKYETMLRLMEARLGATLTASGAIYAIRRACYRPLPPESWIEDFLVPMHARRLGYQVVYDPEATATEVAAPTVVGEFTRRVRLAVGSFRALGELIRTPLAPLVSLALFSHKVLRWLIPFFLIGLLLSNVWLWSQAPFYQAFLTLQLVFYAWAGAGLLFRERMKKVRYALVGYFLLAIHAAFLVGLVRLVFRRGAITWQRVN